MSVIHTAFVAGLSGGWRILRVDAVVGESLAVAGRLAVAGPGEAQSTATPGVQWRLDGATGHARYATRHELDTLGALQQGLRRPEARCAALIPIRKNPAWWALAQDERRAILEEQSHHIAIGLEYLPPIARRLYHARELGQPFDFLTWFEYAPEHAEAFEELVARLRRSAEWQFVDREVDIRLVYDEPARQGAAG
ncbi:chlorite dismutase family protein [Herbaspirillum huttiense]|uniref:chlorite dismutase family protein n=1 Tax=Herbaspirillum huttiense TaxID=863372 RepID=UPI002176EEAD|nr:chlorite dismutase family protein [Herbaspirillum huttiense]UWE14831.1 chlorite dismutase family protein [Herbaspirillum huttiense]